MNSDPKVKRSRIIIGREWVSLLRFATSRPYFSLRIRPDITVISCSLIPDQVAGFAAIVEAVHPGVLQVAIDDADGADIVRQALDAG